MKVADLDGDGRDELALESFALEADGRVRWNTNPGHPVRYFTLHS